MINVNYSYYKEDYNAEELSEYSLHKSLRNMNIEIQQGKLVAIVGPKSGGKATVLRLIAGSVFPSQEEGGASLTGSCVFVPPHLRVVEVHESPFILGPHETIYDNLIYGIKPSPSIDHEALEARARAILQMIGGGDELLANFKEPGYLGWNGMRITRTDKQLIHIARAFVMNPEVLLIYKPTNLLDPVHSQLVVQMLKEFTKNRGLFVPDDEPLIMRRKRTVIFTASSAEVAREADEIYCVRDGRVFGVPEGKDYSGEGDLPALTSDPNSSISSPLPRIKDKGNDAASRKAAKEEAKQLKKEIQTWVETFKSENGKDPSTDDKAAIKPLYDRYFLAVQLSRVPVSPL